MKHALTTEAPTSHPYSSVLHFDEIKWSLANTTEAPTSHVHQDVHLCSKNTLMMIEWSIANITEAPTSHQCSSAELEVGQRHQCRVQGNWPWCQLPPKHDLQGEPPSKPRLLVGEEGFTLTASVTATSAGIPDVIAMTGNGIVDSDTVSKVGTCIGDSSSFKRGRKMLWRTDERLASYSPSPSADAQFVRWLGS